MSYMYRGGRMSMQEHIWAKGKERFEMFEEIALLEEEE